MPPEQLLITINEYESIADGIQAEIIKKVFDSAGDNFVKILISELANNISKLTDHCEDAADLIRIINIKRVI